LSELSRPTISPLLLYGAAAIVIIVELATAWIGLHPNVSANYRGFYIDQTTTCLDVTTSGQYVFGKEVKFRDNAAEIKPLRVCGWEGPAGDGLHAVGNSSMLRFALPAVSAGATVMLELVAVDRSGPAGQTIDISVNGTSFQSIVVETGTPQRFTFSVPAELIAGATALTLELRYPNAIRMNPTDSDTRKRSVKITAARVS
jgi:hypothetical protein